MGRREWTIPREKMNALMLQFFTAQRKALGVEISEDSPDFDEIIANMIEATYWKGYSIGAADAVRILEGESPDAVIREADEHIKGLTTEMRVQSFMDDVEMYENGDGDGDS